MIKIEISERIKSKINELRLGLVEANFAKIEASASHFENEFEKLEKTLSEKFNDRAPSTDAIVSAVRRMYRQVGWEPTKYRPSSEALIRRIIQGKGLYRINNAVDYGNLVSAMYHIPMGLYDIDKLRGRVSIDTGRENESYEGISKSHINAFGKIILRDDRGVFGNPTADSKRTSISPKTVHLIAVFFCPVSIDQKIIKEMLLKLADYYALFSDPNTIKTEVQ